jgi:hypothetical protein
MSNSKIEYLTSNEDGWMVDGGILEDRWTIDKRG